MLAASRNGPLERCPTAPPPVRETLDQKLKSGLFLCSLRQGGQVGNLLPTKTIVRPVSRSSTRKNDSLCFTLCYKDISFLTD
jgi:hypothetical protein